MAAPACGYIGDKVGPFGVVVLGFLLLAATFFFLGPTLKVVPVTTVVVCIDLAALGVASAGAMVCSMPAVLAEGKRLGGSAAVSKEVA